MDEVVSAVRGAPVRLGDTVLVAVDGPSGVGKSAFAAELSARLDGAEIVSTDDFATWAAPVSWWPRLVAGVLEPLRHNESASYRRTEWVDGTPRLGAERTLGTPEILIVEGVSALRRSVAPLVSVGVWLGGGTASQRLARAVDRDGAGQRENLARWQRFERGWFAVDQPWTRANYTVDDFQ